MINPGELEDEPLEFLALCAALLTGLSSVVVAAVWLLF
jgi:hypothetical protein